MTFPNFTKNWSRDRYFAREFSSTDTNDDFDFQTGKERPERYRNNGHLSHNIIISKLVFYLLPLFLTKETNSLSYNASDTLNIMSLSVSSGSEDGKKASSSAKAPVNFDFDTIRAYVTGMYVTYFC